VISKLVSLGEEDHTFGVDQSKPTLMAYGGKRLHRPWPQLAKCVPATLSERRP
jgi:hypothetical protein